MTPCTRGACTKKTNTRQLAYFCPTSFLTVRPLQSFFSNCLVTTHNHNWDQFYISFGVSRQLEVKSHRASCVRISTAILVLFESLVNLSSTFPNILFPAVLFGTGQKVQTTHICTGDVLGDINHLSTAGGLGPPAQLLWGLTQLPSVDREDTAAFSQSCHSS